MFFAKSSSLAAEGVIKCWLIAKCSGHRLDEARQFSSVRDLNGLQ
jgi:hypothetical protein